MNYTVNISLQAQDELDIAFLWLLQRTEHAWDWHQRVLKAIDSLEQYPSRFNIAPEYKRADEEVRHMIVGDNVHG